MYAYAGSLMVEDASGARFQIHEYRAWLFFRRFKLDTGEAAERLDDNTFKVVGTGEPLVIVSDG